jgi:hypothetical protein
MVPVVFGLQIHRTSRCTNFVYSLLQNNVQSQQQEQAKDGRSFPASCTERVQKPAVTESVGLEICQISFNFGINLRTV